MEYTEKNIKKKYLHNFIFLFFSKTIIKYSYYKNEKIKDNIKYLKFKCICCKEYIYLKSIFLQRTIFIQKYIHLFLVHQQQQQHQSQ